LTNLVNEPQHLIAIVYWKSPVNRKHHGLGQPQMCVSNALKHITCTRIKLP